MKTLTLEVSDETAANLEAIHQLFRPDENLGATLDKIAAWFIRDVATNDDENLLREVEDWEFDSTEEALAFTEKVNAYLEKIGGEVPVKWIASPRDEGNFELLSISTEFHESVYDASVRLGVDYNGLLDQITSRAMDVKTRQTGPEILKTIEAEMTAKLAAA